MKRGRRHGQGFWQTGLGYLTQVGVALGAVAAIVTGIVALTGGSGSSGSTKPRTPAANLQTVDLAVAGGRFPQCKRQGPDPPRLDLTVRNVGNQPAVVKRLGLRVADTGLLRVPQAGGGLPPSHAYDLQLPGDPRVGQLLIYKTSQEVPPRGDDRFSVRLDEAGLDRQRGDRLYLLDVLLYHDTDTAPIHAGRVVVSAPFIPTKDFFWAGVAPIDRPSFANSAPKATMLSNEKTLRRFLTQRAERPAALNAALVDVPVQGPPSNPCAGGSSGPEAPETSSTP